MGKPPVPDFQMSHASITPVEIAGRRFYVYPAHGGIAVVDAATGRLVCVSRDFVGKMATCPSAVVLEDGFLLFSGGYAQEALLPNWWWKGTRRFSGRCGGLPRVITVRNIKRRFSIGALSSVLAVLREHPSLCA